MGPVSNAWRSTIIADEALWSSDMLFDMTGSCIELKECLRSDAVLFNAYARLPALYDSTDQASIIQSYRAQFPVQEPCVQNLCISHEMRIRINRKENMRLAPPDAQYIMVQGKQASRCAQQSLFLWPGLQLLGCVGRPRKGVRNSVLYTIQYCEEEVKLVELPATFSYEEIKEFMRLGHCRTYASVQGTEFDESLRLHETGHARFTLRHLFVGLSRAKSKDLVQIA